MCSPIAKRRDSALERGGFGWPMRAWNGRCRVCATGHPSRSVARGPACRYLEGCIDSATEVDTLSAVDTNRRFHSESHSRCQTSKNEDSCRKHADDSPARCSPRHFAKFIHCEHLAGVIGMFSLDTVLESRYVVRKTGGSVAV